MQSAKEKLSNMASAAKEHITICRAKVEEKAERASASTHEEKELAKERRKAKEAGAKMKLHQEKAQHAANRLNAKYNRHRLAGRHHHHHHHHTVMNTAPHNPSEPVVEGHGYQPPLGTAATMAGAYAPAYPLGGHPPHKYV